MLGAWIELGFGRDCDLSFSRIIIIRVGACCQAHREKVEHFLLLRILQWWLMMVHSPCWHHLYEITNSRNSSYLNANPIGWTNLVSGCKEEIVNSLRTKNVLSRFQGFFVLWWWWWWSMGFLLQNFVRNEWKMHCAVPWGETLHELTELKGRRIPVEMIAIHVSFSPLRMFHW